MRSRWRVFFTLIFMGLVFSLVAAGVVAVIIYQTYATGLKSPQALISESSIRTSLAYDRNGALLYEFIDPLGELRDPVALDRISPYLIAATIATEDASFYDNPGVNINGLLRAIRTNLPEPLGEGWGQGSGGSSITQQLVKNVYLTPEERFDRKIERKIKETVIALELKRRYEDDQILEWYLNQIPYGNFAYGAEAAAQRYFGKPAADLTLAEAAMLAGIPQAPGLYTPALPENRERAKARQIAVLDLMLKHLDEINKIKWIADRGKPITAAEIEAARDEELRFIQTRYQIEAPHFVQYVQDQVVRLCQKGFFDPPKGIPCNKVIYRGGLRITTSLDLGLQRIGEQTVEEVISANEERYGGHDGALVAIRPGTGEILAYVGSRDFFREDIYGQVDILTSLKSPGSTMKMFTYLTAFQQGWVPSTMVRDEAMVRGGRPVNNWNFRNLGTITLRTALSQSINVPAVATVEEVGVSAMRSLAYKMGITDRRLDDCNWAITLGACEVKLLDMAYAFSVVANNGVMKGQPTLLDLPDGFRQLDPVAVLKIEDAAGNVIYQYDQPQERKIVEPAHAYMITHILSNEAIRWSGLTIGRPAAAKTGTSEDFRDNTVLGYTPDLTVGVWMGNADNTPMVEGTFSSAGTGPMWRKFMQEAHDYLQLPPRSFDVPANIVTTQCGDENKWQEVFIRDVAPAKPGACDNPSTATPTPSPIKFPTPTPTPKPTTTPTPTPRPSPSATPKPSPTLTPTSTPAGHTYIVQEGDTLISIAQKFDITLKELLDANGLTANSVIKPGDVLIIPD